MYESLKQAAQSIADTPLSLYIQSDPNMFPLLEVLHVISIGLLVGPILLVDLRLMDLGGGLHFQTDRIMKLLVPIALVAFIIALISGALMFVSQPTRYVATPIFMIKMGLIVLAGLNMLLFHRWFSHVDYDWISGAASPIRAKTAGFVSFVLWLSILVSGRFVGFLLAWG